MIKVTDLTKSYGDFDAVDGISFEVGDGDVVGLLGPNGAGKTTTMRMLTGYIVANSGGVNINNKDIIKNELEIKSTIGYMPENNPLYKDMLVKEYLNLTLELNNVSKDKRKERTDFVVNATGIKDKYYRPISELSKGYKQRVGLASALINDPQVLILDEPTEGLDPTQRREIRNLIKEIGKDRTVIVSTHVMQEVEAMCNKIIIIKEGKIVANGTKNEILKKGKGENLIKLKIQGDNVKDELSKIEFVKINNFEKEGKKYFAELETEDSSDEIYKNISKLISKNKWVIYGLESKSESLEEVFDELTN